MKLNLPEFNPKIRTSEQSKQIYDVIRKKYVRLTPEEFVRQNIIDYLIHHENYPRDFISVEKELNVFNHYRRTDIVIYTKKLKPWMIIECKAHTKNLDEQALYQAARYNSNLNAKYLTITNGMQTYIFEHSNGRLFQLSDFPNYDKSTRQ